MQEQKITRNQIKNLHVVPMIYTNDLEPANSIEDAVYEIYYNEYNNTLNINFITESWGEMYIKSEMMNIIKGNFPNKNTIMYLDEVSYTLDDFKSCLKGSINAILFYFQGNSKNVEKYTCTYNE